MLDPHLFSLAVTLNPMSQYLNPHTHGHRTRVLRNTYGSLHDRKLLYMYYKFISQQRYKLHEWGLLLESAVCFLKGCKSTLSCYSNFSYHLWGITNWPWYIIFSRSYKPASFPDRFENSEKMHCLHMHLISA